MSSTQTADQSVQIPAAVQKFVSVCEEARWDVTNIEETEPGTWAVRVYGQAYGWNERFTLVWRKGRFASGASTRWQWEPGTEEGNGIGCSDELGIRAVSAFISANPQPEPVEEIEETESEPEYAPVAEWHGEWFKDDNRSYDPSARFRRILCDGEWYEAHSVSGPGWPMTVRHRSGDMVGTLLDSEVMGKVAQHRAHIEAERVEAARIQEEQHREKVRGYGFTTLDMDALNAAHRGQLPKNHPAIPSLVERGWLVPMIHGSDVLTYSAAAEVAKIETYLGEREGWLTIPEPEPEPEPEFPVELQAGESVAPFEGEHHRAEDDGYDWELTTEAGHAYRLCSRSYERDRWQLARAPFSTVGSSSGGWFWWAESEDNDPEDLAAAVAWCRKDSASAAWAQDVWARYGHMNSERVPWSAELTETELEPRVVRFERYGRVGIAASYSWGWERTPSGWLVEAGSGGGAVDGAFKMRAAYYLTVAGLNEVPTDRWVIVGTDKPHGKDAAECAPGGWMHGGCRARKSDGRFLVDILAEDGTVMGRIGVCAEHLAGRLVEAHGHDGEPWDEAQRLCGKIGGHMGSWLDWKDRLHELTAELVAAALEAGEANPRPDVTAALYAEAEELRVKREAKAAKAKPSKAPQERVEQQQAPAEPSQPQRTPAERTAFVEALPPMGRGKPKGATVSKGSKPGEWLSGGRLFTISKRARGAGDLHGEDLPFTVHELNGEPCAPYLGEARTEPLAKVLIRTYVAELGLEAPAKTPAAPKPEPVAEEREEQPEESETDEVQEQLRAGVEAWKLPVDAKGRTVRVGDLVVQDFYEQTTVRTVTRIFRNGNWLAHAVRIDADGQAVDEFTEHTNRWRVVTREQIAAHVDITKEDGEHHGRIVSALVSDKAGKLRVLCSCLHEWGYEVIEAGHSRAVAWRSSLEAAEALWAWHVAGEQGEQPGDFTPEAQPAEDVEPEWVRPWWVATEEAPARRCIVTGCNDGGRCDLCGSFFGFLVEVEQDGHAFAADRWCLGRYTDAREQCGGDVEDVATGYMGRSWTDIVGEGKARRAEQAAYERLERLAYVAWWARRFDAEPLESLGDGWQSYQHGETSRYAVDITTDHGFTYRVDSRETLAKPHVVTLLDGAKVGAVIERDEVFEVIRQDSERRMVAEVAAYEGEDAADTEAAPNMAEESAAEPAGGSVEVQEEKAEAPAKRYEPHPRALRWEIRHTKEVLAAAGHHDNDRDTTKPDGFFVINDMHAVCVVPVLNNDPRRPRKLAARKLWDERLEEFADVLRAAGYRDVSVNLHRVRGFAPVPAEPQTTARVRDVNDWAMSPTGYRLRSVTFDGYPEIECRIGFHTAGAGASSFHLQDHGQNAVPSQAGETLAESVERLCDWYGLPEPFQVIYEERDQAPAGEDVEPATPAANMAVEPVAGEPVDVVLTLDPVDPKAYHQFSHTWTANLTGYSVTGDCQGKVKNGVPGHKTYRVHFCDGEGETLDVWALGLATSLDGAAEYIRAHHERSHDGDPRAEAQQDYYASGLWLLPEVGEGEHLVYLPDGSWELTSREGNAYHLSRKPGRNGGRLYPLDVRHGGELIGSTTEHYERCWPQMLDIVRDHSISLATPQPVAPVKAQPAPGLYAPVVQNEEREGAEAEACRATFHKYMWLVVEAEGVAGILRSYLTCACTGEKLGNFGRSGPSMSQGTQTKPLGIREASTASAEGVAKRNSYSTTGPWEIVSPTLKRAPVRWDHEKTAQAVVDPARERKASVVDSVPAAGQKSEPVIQPGDVVSVSGRRCTVRSVNPLANVPSVLVAWEDGSGTKHVPYADLDAETAPAPRPTIAEAEAPCAKSSVWRVICGADKGFVLTVPRSVEQHEKAVRVELLHRTTEQQRKAIWKMTGEAKQQQRTRKREALPQPTAPAILDGERIDPMNPGWGQAWWLFRDQHGYGFEVQERRDRWFGMVREDEWETDSGATIPGNLVSVAPGSFDTAAGLLAACRDIGEERARLDAGGRMVRRVLADYGKPVPLVVCAADMTPVMPERKPEPVPYVKPEHYGMDDFYLAPPVVDPLDELRAELAAVRADVDAWGADLEALVIEEAERVVREAEAVLLDLKAAELAELGRQARELRESLGWGPVQWTPVPPRVKPRRSVFAVAASLAGLLAAGFAEGWEVGMRG